MPSVKKPVEAKAGWQGIGVVLSGGERLTIKATGTWVFNPSQPPCDANGARNLPTKNRGEYPLHDVSGFEGQLIARIRKAGQSDQGPFAVGTNASIAVGAGGELQFSINDSIVGSGVGLADNSGALAVEIDY